MENNENKGTKTIEINSDGSFNVKNTNESKHSLCKAIGKVLLFVGSVITFARNFVFNLIFLILALAVILGISFANKLQDQGESALAAFNETSDENYKVEPILYFDFAGNINEAPQGDNDVTRFTKKFSKLLDVPAYHDVVTIEKALEKASTDENIKTVVLNFTKFTGTTVDTALRVKQALLKFREKSPKVEVIAYSEQYSPTSYLMANGANKVVISPLGGFSFRGLNNSQLYFKDLLDRFNIQPYVFKAGEFKSAVEPFEQNGMSPKVKEEYAYIFNKLWINYLKTLSKDAITGEKLGGLYSNPRNYLEQLIRFDGTEAELLKSYNLVDELQSFEKLKLSLMKEDSKDFISLKVTPYLDYYKDEVTLASVNKPNISVIYGLGGIVDEGQDTTTFCPKNIQNSLEQVYKDKNTKALVLFLDTGGGSVNASEKIREMLTVFKEKTKLPVYVSMNSLTASGGYWISTSGDKLYATDNTITGSIGVFGLNFGFHGLLNEYGVHGDGVATSKLAEQNIAKPINDETIEEYNITVESIYKKFIKLVKSARPSLKDVSYKDFAEGRIFVADDAKKLGLVDDLLTFNEVIDKVKTDVGGDDKDKIIVKHILSDETPNNMFLQKLITSTAYGIVPDNFLRSVIEALSTQKVNVNQKPSIMATSEIHNLEF